MSDRCKSKITLEDVINKYKYFHRHNAKHECDTTYAEVKE